MCNLFKNSLNDTPFFRKLHMEERNRGRLNTGVCVLGAWSVLYLQAMSSPHTWCCLEVPSETTPPPPTAPLPDGEFSPFCCWRTCLHVLSPLRVGRVPGGWGLKVSHHHQHLHQCITPAADDWPPVLLAALFPVMPSSPSFWAGSHATVCFRPLFLHWKYQFPFVTQQPQSGYGHTAASGCRGLQTGTITLSPLRKCFVWQEAVWWSAVELLTPKPLRRVKNKIWEMELLGSSCLSHHKSNGKQKDLHLKHPEGMS